MESSGKLLSSRLISLLKNGQWERDDIVTLFKVLVKEFKGRSDDFYTWITKIIHQVEIHKIKASDLSLNDSKIVDHVEGKIEKKAKNSNEKTLKEIMEEICRQGNIDEEMKAQVEDIVATVSECLSASSAPHLHEIKQCLFKLCKAVEKTMSYKPRVTQMVSWCILVLSKSSRLVQVLTGEGKSCIVAIVTEQCNFVGKAQAVNNKRIRLRHPRDLPQGKEILKPQNCD
ncbi:hypothetical protein QQF64_023893 [Cirrhinus molitorella]|uniref:Uncharacterized protein n=1 Tax=Cirrhinus molitorella TaxID=172907 RepID=A0ABR3NJW1_9TELE